MGTRLGVRVCVLTIAAVIAACGDNQESTVDAAICIPVDDANECTVDVCENDQPINRNRDAGEACAAGVCDGAGACVECVADDDCTGGDVCDEASNACVPPTCTDGEQNGNETDVDCGGSCAPMRRCDDGDGCGVGGDCTSGVCGAGSTCAAARCGDGVAQAGEACDDGNDTNGDGCDDGAGDACRATGCGNGVVTGTEVCDDENNTNGDGCDNNCRPTGCGNGFVTTGETCDDGDMDPGDGCSATCQTEAGYTCDAMNPSTCAGTCGDGVVVTGEACDDAPPAEDGDGCSITCAIEPGFDCSGSPSTCAAVCGDGFRASTEGCDDGDTDGSDGCNASCFVEPGWVCAGTPSTCFPICGDNQVVPTEQCDDPLPLENNDGCSASCRVEEGWTCSGSPSTCTPVCGDGLVQAGEACDDPAPAENGDGCSATCTVEAGWSCSGEPSTCTTTCGDGIPVGTEACDDDDTDDGDGCSSTCTVETGFTCSGTPSTCEGVCGDGLIRGTEVCDDAPPAENGDGCSATCTIEPGWTCQGEPSVCAFTCGDGVLDAGEGCDDDGLDDGDGCSAFCTIESGWTCSGTPSSCVTTCGDGLVRGAEACDDDDLDGDDGCSATCTIETGWACSGEPSLCDGLCGDGALFGTEECEDGGAPPVAGDGCDTACHVEAGYECTGTPSVCVTECGDGVAAGAEQCDDGNLLPVDGCDGACRLERTEVEPNEDGSVSTGGSGTDGNDFDTGGIAVANATSQGVYDVASGDGAFIGALTPAGDEDVYAITNSTAVPYQVQLEMWNRAPGFGVGVPCEQEIDTGLNIRDAAGDILDSNDDRDGADDRCSTLGFELAPGQTLYAHVVAFADSDEIDGYGLQILPVAIVCGDGVRTLPNEECDDGGLVNGDGCSSTCTLEGAVTEVEPNDDTAAADAAGITITGDGMIRAENPDGFDIDVFRLDVAAASVVRIESYTVVPGLCDISMILGLYDAAGLEITTDFDESGIGGCSAVVYPLQPGTYYIQAESYDFDPIARYFVEVEFTASLGTEGEPAGMIGVNDTNATAEVSLMNATDHWVFGDSSDGDDVDVYAITVPPGMGLRAEIIEGDTSLELCEDEDIDSLLILFDGIDELTRDDDGGRGYCSLIDGTGGPAAEQPAARNTGTTPVTWHLHVRESTLASTTGAQFQYRLQVTVR